MKLNIFNGLPEYVRMTILSQIRRLLSTPLFSYEDKIDTTLEMSEPMTDERLQKMISIMKTEDACLHLVIFNGELVFNDEEYLMLSDGRKWLCTKNLEIRNGI